MRFRELRLSAYGPFTDESLNFGEREQCDFHVVLGPNEAGKSTTLRAIDALLFGFPNQTLDAHTHPYDRLRVGARIQSAEGELDLARVKRRQGTLRNAADEPLEEEALTQALGGVEPEHYRRLFLIDQEELRSGGRGLLEGGGELGVSLFGATLGAGNLAAQVAHLQKAYEDLFSIDAKARKPPLNAALRAYREHTEKARKLSVRPREYDQARREVQRLAQERAETQANVSEYEGQTRRLQRLQSVAGALARRRIVLDELKGLREVPELAPDASQLRQLASEKLADTERRLKGARETISQQTEQILELAIPRDLLTRADSIRALADQSGQHESALRDRPKRLRELEALQRSINASSERLEHPLPKDTAVFDERSREEVEELAEQHVLLMEQHRANTARLESSRDALTLAEAQVKGRSLTPEYPDALERWAESAAEQLHRAQRTEEHLEKIQRDLDLLTKRAGDLTPAVDLTAPPHAAPPSRATIDSHREQFEELKREHQGMVLRRDQLGERSEELHRQHGALGGNEAQELERQIHSARSERDELLKMIELGQSDDPQRDLENLGELILQADRHVDLAVAQADRIARSRQISGELDVILTQREELEQTIAAHADQHAQLQRGWREQWGACGFEPILEPAVMLVWLERYEELLAQSRQLLADRAREEQASSKTEQIRGELLAACAAVGSPAEENLPLGQLIAHARSVLKRITKTIDTDRALRLALEQTGLEHEQARAELERSERNIASWQARWSEALEPLGLSADATPPQARAQLTALRELTSQRKSISELEHRIRGIDEAYETYREGVAEISAQVAEDLDANEPILAVRALRGRLESALEQNARLAHLQQQRETEEQRLRQLELEGAQASSQIKELLTRAGCSSIEELPAIEERSALRAERERELVSLEQRITEQGEQSAQELEEVLDGRTSDELALEQSNAESLLTQAREARDELIREDAEASERLRMLDHGTQAAAESEQAEQHAAASTGLVNHYLAERGAVILLRRAIDLHRERSAHPVLERAQELLRAFTDGSLNRLLIQDTPSGQPIILARRENGSELDVEGMSTGTRDQLYLALRLAALEHHLHARPPLPVLLDDVLVNSDETRVASGLPALAEISRHTQVIMLTHHRHVASIAEDTLGDRVRVHRLRTDSERPVELA